MQLSIVARSYNKMRKSEKETTLTVKKIANKNFQNKLSLLTQILTE